MLFNAIDDSDKNKQNDKKNNVKMIS